MPEGPPPAPIVQRVRIRYAKRDRLRFSSHRDFARAFERALRRAGIPVAFSAGFSPHPKVSYVGAAPTGAASEAEYLEVGLQSVADPEELRVALDAALPAGLDIVECVEARTPGLPDRIDASRWRIEIPGVTPEGLQQAVTAFLQAATVSVERVTKSGRRTVDVRAAVAAITVDTQSAANADSDPCGIVVVVVRQTTPVARPDDVLTALRAASGSVTDWEPQGPIRATRLAQGQWTAFDATVPATVEAATDGQLADPLAPDRAAPGTELPGGSPATGQSAGSAPSVGTAPAG